MAGRQRRTVEELEREVGRLRRHGVGTTIGRVLSALGMWGALVLIVWFIRDVGIAWAGKTTVASVNVAAAASLEATTDQLCGAIKGVTEFLVLIVAITVVTTVSAILYGRRQAQLRREVIVRLSPFEQMYEKMLDPRRTSSGIQRTGESRLEDR